MASVLILGGGDVGSTAAEQIVDSVESMTIADLNYEAASRVAERLGVNAARADVTDPEGLRELMRDHDLVVNSVGPFYRFGVPTLQAAIDTGTSYVDVCDDWEPTIEMLDMHDAAKAAGIVAIIGAGASPGVSNMLAVAAMNRLDHTDEVFTIWPVFEDDLVSDPTVLAGEKPPGPSIVHWFHQLRGTIKAVKDGARTDLPAMEALTIEYPGVGSVPVWTCGHPEPITIPHHFPAVQSSQNAMATTETVAEFLASITSEADARDLTSKECAELFVEKVRERGVPTDPEMTALPRLQSLAIGTRDGKPATVGVALDIPDMHPSKLTGIPFGIFARSLLEDETGRGGVFAPEGFFDADTFFAALAPRFSGMPTITETETDE